MSIDDRNHRRHRIFGANDFEGAVLKTASYSQMTVARNIEAAMGDNSSQSDCRCNGGNGGYRPRASEVMIMERWWAKWLSRRNPR